MTTRAREIAEMIAALTEDPDERKLLTRSAKHAFDTEQPLAILQEDYANLGFWYAVSKDRKRKAKAEKGDFQRWQLYEDLMESLVKAVNSGLIVQQHLNRMERFN